MNPCTSCGEDFGSLVAFDDHRVGKHAYTYSEGAHFDPPVDDGRRCLTVEEMEGQGFVRNAYGRWTKENTLGRSRRLSERTCNAPTALLAA